LLKAIKPAGSSCDKGRQIWDQAPILQQEEADVQDGAQVPS